MENRLCISKQGNKYGYQESEREGEPRLSLRKLYDARITKCFRKYDGALSLPAMCGREKARARIPQEVLKGVRGYTQSARTPGTTTETDGGEGFTYIHALSLARIRGRWPAGSRDYSAIPRARCGTLFGRAMRVLDSLYGCVWVGVYLGTHARSLGREFRGWLPLGVRAAIRSRDFVSLRARPGRRARRSGALISLLSRITEMKRERKRYREALLTPGGRESWRLSRWRLLSSDCFRLDFVRVWRLN